MQHPVVCTLMMASLVAGAQAGETLEKDPVAAKVVKRNLTNKNQLHECIVDLSLSNDHDFPVWFIISSGNELLPHDGSFASRREHWEDPFSARSELSKKARIVFEATRYNEGSGEAVVVRYGGNDGFRAVLLPATGRLHLARFKVTTRDPPRFIDVWEAKSIIVNRANRLEQFLPFTVMSSKATEIGGDPAKPQPARTPVEGNPFHDPTVVPVDWPRQGAAASRGDQEITSVVVDALRRHVVPLPE
jgi:hypothetical protein